MSFRRYVKTMEYIHKPVLLDECIKELNIKSNGVYVDCTLGGAGHSKAIAGLLGKGGLLIGIDQDLEAVEHSRGVLDSLDYSKERVRIVSASFFDVKQLLNVMGIYMVDGFLVDLGVSSFQLDEPRRGFTYRSHDAPLDMRMNVKSTISAHDVVNYYDEKEIAEILWKYGEERWAKRIAEFIVKDRPVETTGQLVSIIKKAIPAGAREGTSHPAKRSFQAIRIEVNKELEPLADALGDMAQLLAPRGRLCVISFHSLEDRIVKNSMRSLEGQCSCPKGFPICVCRPKKVLRPITKRPILPSDIELENNNRARSAKLRVAEKL